MAAFSKEMVSFVEIARQGSIRRAAEVLNVSPSSLSRQITILENSFGMKLMIRLPSGIRLTEPGKKAYAKALIWAEDQRQLIAGLQGRAGDNPEPLRLGLVACFASHFVSEFHNRLVKQGLNTALEVTVDTTQALVDRLADNRLDVIIAFNITSSEEIRFYFEQDHPLGLVHAPDFDLGGRLELTAEQCLTYPLCLPDASLSYQPRLAAEIARQKIAPNILLKSNSVQLIKDFVASGNAVTFLTRLDVQWEIERGELAFTKVKNKRLVEHLAISIANGKELGAHDKRVLDILVQVLAREFKPSEKRRQIHKVFGVRFH